MFTTESEKNTKKELVFLDNKLLHDFLNCFLELEKKDQSLIEFAQKNQFYYRTNLNYYRPWFFYKLFLANQLNHKLILNSLYFDATNEDLTEFYIYGITSYYNNFNNPSSQEVNSKKIAKKKINIGLNFDFNESYEILKYLNLTSAFYIAIVDRYYLNRFVAIYKVKATKIIDLIFKRLTQKKNKKRNKKNHTARYRYYTKNLLKINFKWLEKNSERIL